MKSIYYNTSSEIKYEKAGDIEWFSDSDSCPSAQDNSSFSFSTSSRIQTSLFRKNGEAPSPSSDDDDEEGQTDAPAKPEAEKKTTKPLKPGFFRNARASRIPTPDPDPDPLPVQANEAAGDIVYKAFLRSVEGEMPAEIDAGSFRAAQEAPSASDGSSPCPGGPKLWHPPPETGRSGSLERLASYESADKGPESRSWSSYLTRSLVGRMMDSFDRSGAFDLSTSFRGSSGGSFSFGKTFVNTYMASMKTVTKPFFGSQICRIPTKRRRSETFRIQLPNGSRIAGLSTMTFGDEKRTLLEKGTYVFGTF